MAELVHGQDIVGIVDKVLPLTGGAGGVPRPKRGHLHRSLTCGTETSPREGRGSRSDWRVKQRFTPRVVTCQFWRALIAVKLSACTTKLAGVPMFRPGLGLS
jgi:hypothetical protein